jgi:pantoate--beta-alanine ligase
VIPVLEKLADLRAWLPSAARPLALVPTMGALHEGHLSLVRQARAQAATLCVSVFVNPLQFGPGEDYAAYPRDLDRDAGLLAAEGVDAIFAPSVDAFTPPDRLTTVRVEGLTDRLEGRSRPGHFDGVTTIVAKLFNAVGPDRAYFGEKDYQQLLVIRRMVTDLDVPVEIVSCPIVREPGGLALSSRNAQLSAAQHADAHALAAALRRTAETWDGDADAARARLRALLDEAPGVTVDYAEIADPETLEPLRGHVAGPARALVAAQVGPKRLIDNVALGTG